MELQPSDMVYEGLLNVTEYKVLGKLPDPFVNDDGRRLTSPGEWPARRAEIYKTAIELQYGTQPPKPEFLEVELLYTSPSYHSFHIHTGTRQSPITFRMQVILPKDAKEKVPVIVDGDQCWRYHMDQEYLNTALDNGIGWVFFDRTELAHDLQGEGRGKGDLYKVYPEYTFGAIGAWAWGYSRCVDALEQIAGRLPIDLDWIAFCGHSRGAKTAMLAGALDERARVVNPNSTCCGACGCYRIHMKATFTGSDDTGERRSETLDDMCRAFPFWLSEEIAQYRLCEENLPFDEHFLKAMVAPRTLYISEAAWDVWANPIGSWQTTLAAKEVFRFLGAEDNLFWSFRPGFHAHDVSDVAMLVNVILHQKRGEPLSERFFKLPFHPKELIFDWKCPTE